MSISISKADGIFRNELIYTVDVKAVNMDNVLVNLFLLLENNGSRPRAIGRRTTTNSSVDLLLTRIDALETEQDGFEGFKANRDIAETWLRTNVVNMVNRGDSDKESLSSLRPIHLEAYKERNPNRNRDYFTSDQVYQMLGAKPSVSQDLKCFLQEGWDSTTNQITNSDLLDVDSLAILHLIKKSKQKFVESSTAFNRVRPILKADAELFCDDISRLLVYKKVIPRSVLIEYLKNVISFHLTLYTHKLIQTLPEMVDQGSLDVKSDWSFVVDASSNLDSELAPIAIEDAARTYDMLYDYIKATFKINTMMQYKKLEMNDSQNLETALKAFKEKDQKFESYFEAKWDMLYNTLDADDKSSVDALVEFEDSYFDRFIEIITKVKGAYQYRYAVQYLDHIAQKNSDARILSQGRSRKHPRRFSLGSKLLETLIQILVLETDAEGKLQCQSLFIEELIAKLRSRYGIILNGLTEERFKNADINTHLAFKSNVEFLKERLRQIGFYNDLSDAYILQKITPRYNLY